MTIQYDPQEHILAVLTRWDGTILPLILKRPLYWLLLFVHAIFLYVDQYLRHYTSRGNGIPALSWDVVALPSSLLVFFLVFYGGNCYTRFYQLWNEISELFSLIVQWVSHLSVVFDGMPNAKELQWRASRLMLAAMQLLFATLNDSGEDEEDDPSHGGAFGGGGVGEHEVIALTKLNLLTLEESERIRRFHGFKPLLPIKWALKHVQTGIEYKRKHATVNSDEFEIFQTVAYTFQRKTTTIVQLLQQPVPLPYFHVLKIQMVIVLILIGYSLVDLFVDEWLFSLITYMIVSGTLIGLQEIAVSMSDPFGDDKTDFDTHKLMNDAYNNAVAYLVEEHYENEKSEAYMVNPLQVRICPTNYTTSEGTHM